MNINIDELLYKDMKWLAEQTRRPFTDFLEIAYRLDLTDEYWDKFWKIVAQIRAEKSEGKDKIEYIFRGKEKRVTPEEFKVVEQILGKFPGSISNCCSAKVLGGDICSDCKEHCGIIYTFE